MNWGTNHQQMLTSQKGRQSYTMCLLMEEPTKIIYKVVLPTKDQVCSNYQYTEKQKMLNDTLKSKLCKTLQDKWLCFINNTKNWRKKNGGDLQIQRHLRNHKPIAMHGILSQKVNHQIQQTCKACSLMETLRILAVNDKLTTLSVWGLTPRADGKLLSQLLLALRTHTLWNMNMTDSYPGGVLGEQSCCQRRWGFYWL